MYSGNCGPGTFVTTTLNSRCWDCSREACASTVGGAKPAIWVRSSAPTAWPDSLSPFIASWTIRKRSIGSAVCTGSGAYIAVTRLPSAPRSASARMDIGTMALSSMPSTSCPLACMWVRRAPATTLSTTSLTVPPSADLIALKWARSPSAHANRRCGPMGMLYGLDGAPCRPATTMAPSPEGALATCPAAPSGCAIPPAPRRGGAGGQGRGVERRGCALGERVRDERGRARLGAREPCRRRLGRRRRVRLEVEQHGRDVDPRDAVDEGVVGLGDDREAAALDAVHQPHLPQRLGAVEPLGEDAAREVAQLLEAGGLGERGVADVVARIEVRVVDPHRPRLREGWEGELLPVARDEVEARGELGDKSLVPGRLALEEHAGADVHVGARVLEREERGVEPGQPVGVGHRGRLSTI